MQQPYLPLLVVSAVLLVNTEKKILLAQRPSNKPLAGMWEFPGGKLEAGESPENALIREIHEELGITLRDISPVTFASHSYETFHLLMPVFLCCSWQGEIHAKEGQNFAWVEVEKLCEYPMPAADIPLIPTIKNCIKTL